MDRILSNKMPEETDDKYIDSIELSNSCRQFYQSRVETARNFKEKWAKSKEGVSDNNGNMKKKSSLDLAMEKLRTEMASLMDQDLSLMKQLLTLNEEIEELKWRRRYAWSKNSMASSGDLESNDWTESDVSMCIPETDIPQKYPSPSSLSLQETHSASFYDDSDPCGTFNRSKAKSKVQTLLSKKSSFNERGSFDSGIHVGFNDSPTNTAERTTRVTQL